MIILHGENQPQSRQKLLALISEARDKGKDLVRIEASGLTTPQIEEALGATDLFGQEKIIVFEGLHSLVKSKRKDELLKYLAKATEIVPSQIEVVLWESRTLTKTMLKPFGGANVLEFKVSNSVFKWLDSLSPDSKTKKRQLELFHEAVANEDEFMCFAMLIRQIRLLIQAKDVGTIKGAPFMITKLKKQAQPFELEKLLATHQKLLEIDLKQKTSSAWLPLAQELDLLLLQL